MEDRLMPSHMPIPPNAHTTPISVQGNALRPTLHALRGLTMLLWAWMAAALTLSGCDDTDFDPFQESDFHFSIGGYLDGGVDTQFVRITPVRDSIALSPGPLDAAVSLEHLATGAKTALKDSLFRYRAGLSRFAERTAYNFWTTLPLEPLATYHLTVTRSDGAMSAATVTLPDTFPDPIFEGSVVRMRGIERLAAAQVTYWVVDLAFVRVFERTFNYLPEVSAFQDELRFIVKRGRDEAEMSMALGGVPLQVLRIDVTVAAAGPDWPDFTALDEETFALPDVVSNVENGVGYLGGIISKTLTMFDAGIPFDPRPPP